MNYRTAPNCAMIGASTLSSGQAIPARLHHRTRRTSLLLGEARSNMLYPFGVERISTAALMFQFEPLAADSLKEAVEKIRAVGGMCDFPDLHQHLLEARG